MTKPSPMNLDLAMTGRLVAFGFFVGTLMFMAPSCIGPGACEALRKENLAKLDEWTRCEASNECVLVGGNAGDCSGVFKCNFGANYRFENAARRAVIFSAQDSPVCQPTCASAIQCPRGTAVICDPVLKRCRVESMEGGIPELDSGGAPAVP